MSSVKVISYEQQSTTNTAPTLAESDDDQLGSGSVSWRGGSSVVSSIYSKEDDLLPSSPMDNILPPLRPLTTEEQSQLSELLRGKLNLTNTSCALQAEEDATDLINYVSELIEDKMTVGDICEGKKHHTALQ